MEDVLTFGPDCKTLVFAIPTFVAADGRKQSGRRTNRLMVPSGCMNLSSGGANGERKRMRSGAHLIHDENVIVRCQTVREAGLQKARQERGLQIVRIQNDHYPLGGRRLPNAD